MKFKTVLITIAALLCMAAFSLPVSANADVSDSDELSVNDSVESYTPLTPSGTLTVIDDVHQLNDEDTIEDKQFITVQSKNGNTFYIIIDRSGTAENVYFLNAVDEADLLALIDDETTVQTTASVCICTDKCELGSVNADCSVCSVNKDNCLGTASELTETTEDETSETSQSSSSSLIILIVFALIGAGGAFYWFKIRNKKSSTKGATDPQELFEDDDYEIEDDDAEDADASDEESEDFE